MVDKADKDPVFISYPDLQSNSSSLIPAIEKAFGSHPDCLGIILVRDLPQEYTCYRDRLLRLAYKFAKLDETTKESFADPSSRYSFGWSHGKEIMNGQPDLLKGSYYANPIIDKPSVSEELKEKYPEYYKGNIWPTPHHAGLEGFEDAFKNLGRLIFKVGCELATACQPFVLDRLDDTSISLPRLISTSQTTKARLLHYFPPSGQASVDEPIDSWCGFHLDHSLLTGLCSAMYLQEVANSEPTVVPSPSPASGLYIRNRAGQLYKVTIPGDCLAFQTGEALEVVTGGKLRATPHCVHVGNHEQQVSRETFALFMQPDIEQELAPSVNFGQFSRRIFEEHYGQEASV